ncbi:GNAT family N-acetyltransferase [Erythrobacter sp. SCSIO 43205]|uniref:GNAT family N-acetyltransferase n=1 Tax=Erythrobacter sp. SCSIO 43205 TaxID=2779361 RepID=UPI001CA9E057|nr:GNAT family N-acetyltransferase [Erythrobacter sp. SCSIO 43205]UAB79479.1 GNAT family N-acetyltransferase [Erythrobacter sp. SCSIO 43205]
MDLARTPTIGGFAEEVSTLAKAPSRPRGVLHLLDTQTVDSKAFRADWEALARQCAEPNPFFEAWFTLPSFEQFADSDAYKIAAYWVGGRLTGLMPIKHSNDYYGHGLPYVGTWLHDHSFCGSPLVTKGQEKGFWKALVSCLDQTPGQALFLHLPALPEGGALDNALVAVLAEMDRASAVVERSSRAMLASNLSPEEYLAEAMSAKKRKELRRQKNRLSEFGELSFERLEGAECIEPWIEQYLTLEAAGWKGVAGSALKSKPASYAFFADAMYSAARAGKLERLALRLDGKPIAMLANFIAAPGAFSFKTAFDEDYARFSPGLLLQIENLDLLNRQDIAWTDSCAVEGHSMIERIWREKRAFVSRNVAIGGSLRRLTARALMAYETRVWN